MIVDNDLSELFCKETGKVVDNTNQPYIDDYIKWLESKVNNVVLDDVKKCAFDCENPVFEKGASYCKMHMEIDGWS